MRNHRTKRIVATLSCILLVGSLLLVLAACSGNSTPGSPASGPNSPQNTTPGYSLIGAVSYAILA